jgi:hypothetical protein
MRLRIRIRDLGIFSALDLGSGMEKIRIRDKHPGSATLSVIRTQNTIRNTEKYIAFFSKFNWFFPTVNIPTILHLDLDRKSQRAQICNTQSNFMILSPSLLNRSFNPYGKRFPSNTAYQHNKIIVDTWNLRIKILCKRNNEISVPVS